MKQSNESRKYACEHDDSELTTDGLSLLPDSGLLVAGEILNWTAQLPPPDVDERIMSSLLRRLCRGE